MKVWDLTAGRTVFEARVTPTHPFGTAYTAAFSPPTPTNLRWGDGAVTIWNWWTEQTVHTFPGHETIGSAWRSVRDGRHLATGNWSAP